MIFPRDENIYKASVTLVVSTLKAIEDAIGFFSSNQGKRLILTNMRIAYKHELDMMLNYLYLCSNERLQGYNARG